MFKCTKCGSALDYAGDGSQATCLVCGLEQSIEQQKRNLDNIYNNAVSLAQAEDIESLNKAIKMFEQIFGWKDTEEHIKKCYVKLSRLRDEQEEADYKRSQAAKEAQKKLDEKAEKAAKRRKNAPRRRRFRRFLVVFSIIFIISVIIHIFCVVIPENKFTNIASVYANSNNTVGVKHDGTVVVAGDNSYHQKDAEQWTDVVDISMSYDCIVGLTSDGRVLATGDNHYGECDVTDWTDVAKVYTNDNCTVGLKTDGTVAVAGGRGDYMSEVDDWTGIVDVYINEGNIVGLKSKGTLCVSGDEEYWTEEVQNWKKIKTFHFGNGYVVGLKTNGRVVCCYEDEYPEFYYYDEASEEFRTIDELRNISYVYTNNNHFVCVTEDGEIIVCVNNIDDYDYYFNQYSNQPVLSDDEGARLSEDYLISETILLPDGTVGSDEYNVSDWYDITAIAVSYSSVVGLRSDGTLVAVGSNYDGSCLVGREAFYNCVEYFLFQLYDEFF